MKMKIINSILKIITIAILFSSCNTKNTYVEEVFGGQYRLPKDFKLALEYIDTELDEDEKTYAYQQLIIENSQSFYFDFNTVKNAPSFTTSLDGKLRIYHFYQGMHESPPILQFCNSKGKIITTHITSESLYSTTDLENITTKEYKYGDFSGYAEILGMIKMKKRIIYLSHYQTLTGNMDDTPGHCVLNFHGHTHQTENFTNDYMFMYHVGVDSHDCYPVHIDDALVSIKERRGKGEPLNEN